MLHDTTHAMLTTMVAAISMGILFLVISRRLNIPGIVLLLLGGFALGPSGAGIVQPDSLGGGLTVIASLAIALILFEGGLTLDLDGYLKASAMIKRLLSVGVIVTWLTTAVALYLIFQIGLSTALVTASLVIVTGPTVIAPLLRRINVTDRIRTILHWEGVLIDPIGVFVALLCFEWIATDSGAAAVTNFGIRVALGFAVGILGGLFIDFAIKHRWVPEHMVNTFALAMAVLIFGFSEAVLSESGLLTVTVAGFVLGFKKPVRLEQIKEFKEQITELLIGTLFILLSARLSIEQFVNFGVKGLIAVLTVMFIVRPLSIFLCSLGLGINWREKLFLSWVAPRGIVAASMAALFVLSGKLDDVGPDERFIETFVYSVITATIILQGFTAGWLAKILGIYQPERNGWVIVGAHPFARAIARFIRDQIKSSVILLDANSTSIAAAKREGLPAILGDARNLDSIDLDELLGVYSVGNILAVTDNEDLNTVICQRWSHEIDSAKLFRWGRLRENSEKSVTPGKLVWTDLPKPSLLSDAIASKAISVSAYGTLDSEHTDSRTPIALVNDGKVVLEPLSEDAKDYDALQGVLYLEQQIKMPS